MIFIHTTLTTLIYFSCGMDACEHEYESMSRHNRKVPTSFYHRFARDACALSDKYAGGKLISVLEGGYSDRALTSGAFAHLTGLVEIGEGKIDETWWSLENLVEARFFHLSVRRCVAHESVYTSWRRPPRNGAGEGYPSQHPLLHGWNVPSRSSLPLIRRTSSVRTSVHPLRRRR